MKSLRFHPFYLGSANQICPKMPGVSGKERVEKEQTFDYLGIEARARGEGVSCIGTVGIGTRKRREEASMSRYNENRDIQG